MPLTTNYFVIVTGSEETNHFAQLLLLCNSQRTEHLGIYFLGYTFDKIATFISLLVSTNCLPPSYEVSLLKKASSLPSMASENSYHHHWGPMLCVQTKRPLLSLWLPSLNFYI